jgi:hypothetical protein
MTLFGRLLRRRLATSQKEYYHSILLVNTDMTTRSFCWWSYSCRVLLVFSAALAQLLQLHPLRHAVPATREVAQLADAAVYPQNRT